MRKTMPNTINRGAIQYELTNHLGNVMAVVTGKKLRDADYNYLPDLVSSQDYSPFGMQLEGRSWNSKEYRFGFNGQQKDDEIYNEGNAYSAQFWEYDARLGRRWNLDPKPNPSISDYVCFANAPIWFSDPMGDTARVQWGGFLGIGRNEARYVGDKWVAAKTRETINFSEVKNAKVKKIMQTYSDLNNDEDLNEMTSAINNRSEFVNLKFKGEDYAGEPYGLEPMVNVHKYIRFDKKNIDVYLPICSGSIMTHELGHVMDIFSQDESLFDQIIGMPKDFTNSEVNAMYWENIYNLTHNLPLRYYYQDEMLPANIIKTHTETEGTLIKLEKYHGSEKGKNYFGYREFTFRQQ
jgi:RHS repeat-associated protein